MIYQSRFSRSRASGGGREAAFLLHEVFDFDYSEIAQIIGKSQASCRQSSTAGNQFEGSASFHPVPEQTHTELVEDF